MRACYVLLSVREIYLVILYDYCTISKKMFSKREFSCAWISNESNWIDLIWSACTVDKYCLYLIRVSVIGKTVKNFIAQFQRKMKVKIKTLCEWRNESDISWCLLWKQRVSGPTAHEEIGSSRIHVHHQVLGICTSWPNRKDILWRACSLLFSVVKLWVNLNCESVIWGNSWAIPYFKCNSDSISSYVLICCSNCKCRTRGSVCKI